MSQKEKQTAIDKVNQNTRNLVRFFWQFRIANELVSWQGGVVYPREELKGIFKDRRRALADIEEYYG